MGAKATLGEAVRFRRCQLGLTQEQLAERIGDGVRQAEISRLETGRVALPRRERLARIAAALDLSLGELLVRSGWDGAEAAFRQERSSTTAAVPPPAGSPVSEGTTDQRPKPVTRLRDAIVRAKVTQTEAARALDRARATYDAACVRCDHGWKGRFVT